MTATQLAATKEILDQIAREPRFRALTTIPVLSVPTAGVLILAYALFAVSSWAWIAGAAPAVLTMPLSGVAIFIGFTPLHDATHRSVSRIPWLNDLLGSMGALLLFPGITTRIYRYLHLAHHRYTGEAARDPDEFFCSAPAWFRPVTWAFLDLWWVAWYFRHWRERPRSERIEFSLGIGFYVAVIAAGLLSSLAFEFTVLWLVPQRIAFLILIYLFAYIQHPEGVEQRRSPIRATVMIKGGLWRRILMLGQSQHLMHHMFPSVPFYRYYRAWDASQALLSDEPVEWRWLLRREGPAPGAAPGEGSLLEAEVREVADAGEEIRAFTLKPAEGGVFPAFEPGAHIDVHLPDGLTRQYSLAGDPAQSGEYQIAVKREADGRGGSRAAHALLAKGTKITIGRPRNHFPLADDIAEAVLIAGGIGLTPLLSMAYALRRRSLPFALHICARTETAVPFAGKLGSLPFADRIAVHCDDAGPEQALHVAAALGDWRPGRHLYLCGPSGFMAWVIAEARAAGWPDAAIHTETFAAPALDPAQNAPFEVRLAKSGRTIKVEAGQSLLDALNAARCGVPASCEQGVCGSCLTRVLKGRPLHRDAFLSDVERAAGDKMLACVSRACEGEVLTLDL